MNDSQNYILLRKIFSTGSGVIFGSVLLLSMGPGCAGGKALTQNESVRMVQLRDFALSPAPPVVSESMLKEEGIENGGSEILGTPDSALPENGESPRFPGESEGSDTEIPALDLRASSYEVDSSRARTIQPGESLIVDRMVGQVNGRPIYANSFFEPLADELVALGEEMTRLQFQKRASDEIKLRLRQVVLNELFLAEAEAGLSPEQQQGVFAWLQSIEEKLYRQHAGSEAQARQQLREEGLTVSEYLDDVRTQALIQQVLREKIQHRVIVSWRDVEREYRRHYEMFNPAPRLVVQRIRLHTERDAEVIAAVQDRLDSGESSFGEVAVFAGHEEGEVWNEFELGAEGVAGIDDLHPDFVRLLEGLQVGQTSAAFTKGNSTWWLHVVALERPPGKILYDPEVQRRLAEQIRARRSNEEQNRYIQSLMKEGIFDELDTMALLLLEVALSRYGP